MVFARMTSIDSKVDIVETSLCLDFFQSKLGVVSLRFLILSLTSLYIKVRLAFANMLMLELSLL